MALEGTEVDPGGGAPPAAAPLGDADLEMLARIGVSLGAELDLARLVQLITDEATALCRAQFGAFFYNLGRRSDGTYDLFALSGVPRERFADFPMPRPTAVFGPTFRGEEIVRSDDITRDPRYGKNPPYHGMPEGHLPVRSYLAVPVVSRRSGVIGGLIFGHAQPGVFAARDEKLIASVAGQAAIAFDNARLYAEAQAARAEAESLARENARLYRETQEREEAARFLAEASVLLASSLDYQATLQSVANVLVPRLADWCAVEVFEAGSIRQIAVAHVDPAKVALAHELQARWPIDLNAPTGTANVLRTGRSELYPEIADELLALLARDEEQLRIARTLGLRSALVVPLPARGRTLGAILLVWAESDRRYGPRDVPLMEELGRRAGVAIDNARLYEEAQRAIRVRDDFLSIASHELKTPLTSLCLHVGGMQRHVRRGRLDLLAPERIAPKIQAIDSQLQRLATLINGLLDVSRASGGRLQLELEQVELTAVVRQVVARLAADLRNARCEVALALDGPLWGIWDRLRLEQVVTNFLSNALKYGAGQPIEIAAALRGERAVLSVRDHGIGIAPADQVRIFERFARAVSAEHFGGLGLGLWIVRVFVAAMGGTVRVESEPGAGSTFFAELPLRAPGEEPDAPAPPSSAVVGEPPR